MPARVEDRGLGKLLEQRALALARRGRHDDLDDREEVARSRMRFGQTAPGEPQLPAGMRSRRDLEAHRSAERGHLHARAENGLPRRERKIEEEIVAAHAKEPMRMQCDIEIQVAVASAVQPLASLAGQAQALAVGGALGNARFEGPPHAARETALVVLGDAQLQVHLGAAVGLFQRDVRRDLVVLPGHWNLAAAPSGAVHPARQAGEQIPQVDIVERERALAELPLPPRGRPELLSGTMAAQLIVGGAFFRVPQGFIGFAELLELRLGVALLGNVRMILSRELAVCVLDLLGARLAVDAHHAVVVLVFHPDSRPLPPAVFSLTQASLVRLGLRRLKNVSLYSDIRQAPLVILVGAVRFRDDRPVCGNLLPPPGVGGVAVEAPNDVHLQEFSPGAIASGYNAFRFSAEVLPFLPVTSSYPTFWPSFKVDRPAFSTAETCTNTSFEPSSA